MAVTTENSTQYAAKIANPPTILEANEDFGRKRIISFDFAQGAAAGDANSLTNLVKLPAGKIKVLAAESRVFHSAFGASRTLDVGYLTYVNSEGTTVAAAEAGLHSAADVSAAGDFVPYDALGTTAGGAITFDSLDGVVIQAKCEAGTQPAAATLNGYFTIIEY